MSDPAFDIAASGMSFHRAQIDALAQRIAAAGTSAPGTTAAPSAPQPASAGDLSFADLLDGSPFESAFSFALDGDDPSQQPAAAAFGAAPDSDDPIQQMVSLVAAGRAYDADVASLQAAKQMDVEAIDVDRS